MSAFSDIGSMAEAQVKQVQQGLSPQSSWKTLLERVADREADAFSAIYDEACGKVYSVAFAIVGNAADAEEVTLDVFFYVWESASAYDPSRGTISTWLIMLARSRAIERLRKRASIKDTRNNYCLTNERLANTDAACNSLLSPRDQAILIDSVLEQLPAKDQELIQLAFFSGLSHSELASKLNIPLGTVKTRIRVILSRLRNLIE